MNTNSLTKIFFPMIFLALASACAPNKSSSVLLGFPVAQVSLGGAHSCVLSSGKVKCWGDDFYGQTGTTLGTGPLNPPVTSPKDLRNLEGFEQIDAGDLQTCAVRGGAGYCWGGRPSGRSGRQSCTHNSIYEPMLVPGLESGITKVRAGGGLISCVLTTAGGVKCQGAGFIEIVALAEDTGAVSGLCSGEGLLGIGNNDDHFTDWVEPIGLSSGVADIGLGKSHSCVLMNDGSVKCWGANYRNQSGGDTRLSYKVPVTVAGIGEKVVSLAVGIDSNCVLTESGAVLCWGWGWGGNLGDGNEAGGMSAFPVQVKGLASGVKSISAGGEHYCAIKSDGSVYCWGKNTSGQIGDGSYSPKIDSYLNARVPVRITPPTGTTSLILGGNHTCAIYGSGKLACWGSNFVGQLGFGLTSTRELTPVYLSADPSVMKQPFLKLLPTTQNRSHSASRGLRLRKTLQHVSTHRMIVLSKRVAKPQETGYTPLLTL